MKLGVHRGSKVTEPDFSGKLLFSKKLGKRVQKGLKIESLLFARNDLKWSVIWLANFLCKSHIWENSRSQDLGQKGKNRVFGILCKIKSLVFARNDLKWSVLWLTNFLRKSHIWENSYSRDLCAKALDQIRLFNFSNYYIFWIVQPFFIFFWTVQLFL